MEESTAIKLAKQAAKEQIASLIGNIWQVHAPGQNSKYETYTCVNCNREYYTQWFTLTYIRVLYEGLEMSGIKILSDCNACSEDCALSFVDERQRRAFTKISYPR